MTAYLLTPDDPSPVIARRLDGTSSFVIAVDHGGRRIPRRLENLGVEDADLARHIAWDIGALDVAELVSRALDAPLVAQAYSRLVIDCNRRVDDPTSIPTVSELTAIPGNCNLFNAQAIARQREIFEPYHSHLQALLDQRIRSARRTTLILQHSMTDIFKGVRRDMHAAVVYDQDRRFAGCLLDALRIEAGIIVADNEPYSGKQRIGYTPRRHGEDRGIPYAEIEIRQDLLTSRAGIHEWADRVTQAMLTADEAFLRAYT